MADMRRRRNEAQPSGIKTFGSTFVNPEDPRAEGRSAGQLLDAAGCRGLQVGGARLSPKHANFVENTGEATTADVLAVMSAGPPRPRALRGGARARGPGSRRGHLARRLGARTLNRRMAQALTAPARRELDAARARPPGPRPPRAGGRRGRVALSPATCSGSGTSPCSRSTRSRSAASPPTSERSRRRSSRPQGHDDPACPRRPAAGAVERFPTVASIRRDARSSHRWRSPSPSGRPSPRCKTGGGRQPVSARRLSADRGELRSGSACRRIEDRPARRAGSTRTRRPRPRSWARRPAPLRDRLTGSSWDESSGGVVVELEGPPSFASATARPEEKWRPRRGALRRSAAARPTSTSASRSARSRRLGASRGLQRLQRGSCTPFRRPTGDPLAGSEHGTARWPQKYVDLQGFSRPSTNPSLGLQSSLSVGSLKRDLRFRREGVDSRVFCRTFGTAPE